MNKSTQRIVTSAFAFLVLTPLALVRPVVAQTPSPGLSTPLQDAASQNDPKTIALKKEIQGYYEDMDRAAERLDLAGSFKYNTKDTKFLMADGKPVSLQTLKDNWKLIYNRAMNAKSHTEITAFVTKNDTVTVETHTLAMIRIKDDSGIIKNKEFDSQSRDFWTKVKGKWFIKQVRSTDGSIKINGQIIQE